MPEQNKAFSDCVETGLIFRFCGWEKCRPGHTFGPAMRMHYLFHFILSGKGKYERNGKTFHLSGGQGFLILPGETIFYQADEQEPWEYCWIGFDGDHAQQVLADCGFDRDQLIYQDRSGGLLAREMMRLVETFQYGNAYELTGRLYLCFSQMVQKPGPSSTFGRSYADQALVFLRNNFSYDISVEDVARHIGIDRTYLYRVFRTYMGISPKEYLTTLRLKQAALLLEDDGRTITEIAYSCGFRELSLFDRHFRKKFGLSPLQYRKDLQNKRNLEKIDKGEKR